MTRITLGAAGLLLASTSIAAAGALDRSGQPVGPLFEPGSYAEFSFGLSMPTVEGATADGAASGDVAEDYTIFGGALKYDIVPNLGFAFIVDTPFGTDISYGDADPGYLLGGTTGEFNSVGYTALARYSLDNGFSVHGGLRAVTVDANLDVNTFVASPLGPAPIRYQGDFAADTGLGYVVGVAYERPEIALRVALTYSSAIEMSHETDYVFTTPFGVDAGSGLTEYDLPQSVNLDFRTGIAEGTAIFGSVRWVDWSEVVINAPGYFSNPIVAYSDDYITYTLGVGRQLTERLTGTAAVVYQPATDDDGIVSDLSPYDGQLGLVLAATYKATDAVEVTGSVRYTRLGDVSTGIGAEFEDNDLLGLGVRVAYRF